MNYEMNDISNNQSPLKNSPEKNEDFFIVPKVIE